MGLIAHYRLDGNAVDRIGDKDGTVFGGLTWTNDLQGAGAVFNGTDTHIDMGDVHDIGTKDFSISFWIKTTQFGYWVLSKSRAAGQENRYGVGIDAGSGSIRFLLSWELGGNHTDYIGTIPVTDGNVHHVGITLSFKNRVRIYVDGVLDIEADVSTQPVTNFQTPDIFRLGSYSSSADAPTMFFNGTLADVRLYDHELSEREIRDLSLGQFSHYPLKGDVNDALTGGLMDVGSSVFVDDPTKGTVIDATGNTVTIPLADIPLNLKGETISAWIKCGFPLASSDGGSFGHRIIQWGTYYANNSGGFGLQSGGFSYYLKGPISSGWTNTGGSSEGAIIYNQGGWIHYVVVFGEDDTFKVYMNGTKIWDFVLTEPYTGLDTKGLDFGTLVEAQISDVKVFKRSLTEEQITEIYEQRASIDREGSIHTTQLKQSPRVRYIRDYVNGSTSNAGNHWIEIQAYDFDGVNVALNSNAYDPSGGPRPELVDGITSTGQWPDLTGVEYMEVDLGSPLEIEKIIVWHYYGDARTYHDVLTLVSEDGVTWTTLYDSTVDGEYTETAEGKTHSINEVLRTRLIDKGFSVGEVSEIGPADNLVAWYPLMGDTLDYAGANHATTFGATPSTEGYYFNGTSRLEADTPTEILAAPQEWTVSAWIFVEDVTVPSQSLNDYNNKNWILYSSTGKPLLYLNGGENDHYVYGSPLTSGQWYHMTFVFNQEALVCDFYVNGSLDKSSTNIDATDVPSGIPTLTKFGENFLGTMRDVRIYNRELSPEEIGLIYKMTNPDGDKVSMTNNRLYVRNQIKEVIC